jgi:hypothetical protein
MKVNFDYEYQLFENRSFEAANKEWEYLFFISREKRPLNNINQYSDEYLKKLETFGIKARFDKSSNELWNGKLEPRQLYQKLNSRITSTQIGQKLGLVHPKAKINEFIDGFLIKSDAGFSGRGFKKQIPQGDYVSEPRLVREKDFSMLIDGEKTSYYETYIDWNFQFKGVKLTKIFPDFIRRYSDKFELLKEEYNKINPHEIWSADFYLSEGKLYLSEVNYRKTMGYIFREFSKEIDFQSMVFNFDGEGELLSPQTSRFQLFVCWD